MKITSKINIVLLIISFKTIVYTQILDYNNRVSIRLKDDTEVNLVGEWNADGSLSSKYYFLPTNLKLSYKSEDPSTPEFLFMKYTSDDSNGDDLKGALLHFLMEWGLSENQKLEAELLLKEKVQSLKTQNQLFVKVVAPKIVGPVDVHPEGEASFRIISATLNNNSKATVITSGIAPNLPGAKAAVAAKLDKNDAQLLDRTFDKARSITDISIQMFFRYNMMRPAIKGEAIIDWTEISKQFERFSAKGNLKPDENCKDCDDDSKDEYVKDVVFHEFYDLLIKSKAIEIKTADLIGNDKTQEFLDRFYAMFTNMIATPVHENDPAPKGAMSLTRTEDLRAIYNNAETWNIKFDKLSTKIRKGKEIIKLDHVMSLPFNMYVLGNMASWYNGAKSNKKCVSSVNLNDPFFQTRSINFIVDNESVKLFDDEVNFVTLQVRKRRSNGNPFEKSITISKVILKDKGLFASTNYARGEDKDPSTFEYKAIWSLKGGKSFPNSPDWIVGDWESVNLVAPTEPRPIEFEADLEKMKELGFRRATLQLRYNKYNQEVETNLSISIAAGTPLVSKTIYTDRSTNGYVYRFILTHETAGKLVFDWMPAINDDDVYLSLSDELKDKDSKLFKEALYRGQNVTAPKDGLVDGLNKILENFKNVLNKISNLPKPNLSQR